MAGIENLNFQSPPNGLGLLIGLGVIVAVCLFVLKVYLNQSRNIKNTARFIFLTFLAQSILFWIGSFFLTDALEFVHTIFFKIIKTATILSGALYLNETIDFYIWQRFVDKSGISKVPTFLQNSVSVLIYMLAIAAIIRFIFVRDEGALVTLTGGAALLLGYAAREVIAQVFAALALNMTPAFHRGDVIQYDQKLLYVDDMNWRFVTFLDRQGNRYCVPNSQLMNSAVLNVLDPGGKTGIEILFEIELTQNPEEIVEILKKELIKNEFYNPGISLEVNILMMHKGFEFVVHFPAMYIMSQRIMYEVRTQLYIQLWKLLQHKKIKFLSTIQVTYDLRSGL